MCMQSCLVDALWATECRWKLVWMILHPKSCPSPAASALNADMFLYGQAYCFLKQENALSFSHCVFLFTVCFDSVMAKSFIATLSNSKLQSPIYMSASPPACECNISKQTFQRVGSFGCITHNIEEALTRKEETVMYFL